jgi:uncharacterized protein
VIRRIVLYERLMVIYSPRFVAGTHVAVLSVAGTDGRPPASVPIWYVYSPCGNIQISTISTSRKTKLIAKAGAI